MEMLSQLLSLILAETPLTISIPEGEDCYLDSPERLFDIHLHHKIGDIVAEACRSAGLTEGDAIDFGEFVAEVATGWSTRYGNELNVLFLDDLFGEAAFGDPATVIRLYLLPHWGALSEHLPAIQKGMAAAFEGAKSV